MVEVLLSPEESKTNDSGSCVDIVLFQNLTYFITLVLLIKKTHT